MRQSTMVCAFCGQKVMTILSETYTYYATMGELLETIQLIFITGICQRFHLQLATTISYPFLCRLMAAAGLEEPDQSN